MVPPIHSFLFFGLHSFSVCLLSVLSFFGLLNTDDVWVSIYRERHVVRCQFGQFCKNLVHPAFSFFGNLEGARHDGFGSFSLMGAGERVEYFLSPPKRLDGMNSTVINQINQSPNKNWY